MFSEGTEFRYTLTKTQDDRITGSSEEVYRIVSVEGDKVRVELDDGSGKRILETDTGCGSYVFDVSRYSVVSKSPVQIELEGHLVYADVYEPTGLCGGSTSVYLGRDGIAYRVENTQLWSGGVVYREKRRLVSISAGGHVYEDIKWVDEGECSEEPEED